MAKQISTNTLLKRAFKLNHQLVLFGLTTNGFNALGMYNKTLDHLQGRGIPTYGDGLAEQFTSVEQKFPDFVAKVNKRFPLG